MLTKFTNKIGELDLRIANAIDTEKAARNAYLDSRNTRSNNIDAKVKELEVQLVSARADNGKLPQQMADALSEADVNAAVRIEKQITESNAKIFELEHSLELLGRVMTKGEPALFKAALEAHRLKLKQITAITEEFIDIKLQVDKLMQELKQIQETLESKIDSTRNLYRRTRSDNELIEMYESFVGPIDVSGHTAAKDEEAKIRFINGSLAGIENTPAGRKLVEQIEERGE